MDNNQIRLKNYQLSIGELGLQVKFNKDISQSEINFIMGHLDSTIKLLEEPIKFCRVLYKNAKKEDK